MFHNMKSSPKKYMKMLVGSMGSTESTTSCQYMTWVRLAEQKLGRFVTYHNALGRDLYLRIATDLHLKRMLRIAMDSTETESYGGSMWQPVLDCVATASTAFFAHRMSRLSSMLRKG